MPLEPPTLEDVRVAALEIEPHLSLPTPLVASPALSELLQADVSLKLEFTNPVSAFKVRGGLNLAAHLSDAERGAGLVTASTGNHGQSIAFAGQKHGVRTSIFVPARANPDKVAAIRRLGAEIHQVGERFDDAVRAAEAHAEATGMRFVSSGDEPHLIAGVGTAALEVLEQQQPETDLVIVPVGGGSGVCGWLTVRGGLGHPAAIWGVQSSQSPAAYEIMGEALDRFVLVTDPEIDQAVLRLLVLQHLLVEPAGAASIAAAFKQPELLRGRRVVLMCSGANITERQLRALLDMV